MKVDEVPFDFERRRVSVLLEKAGEAQRLLIVKGAPEDVLKHSTHHESSAGNVRPLGEADRVCAGENFAGLGKEGFRALGVAYRCVSAAHATAVVGDEDDLIFAGFLVFLAPPKRALPKPSLNSLPPGSP